MEFGEIQPGRYEHNVGMDDENGPRKVLESSPGAHSSSIITEAVSSFILIF
jgi:hypothetical protein